MTFFWSEIGSGFGDPDGTPLPRIPRSTPRCKPIKKNEKSDLKINNYSVKTGPLADNYSHWVAALEFVTRAVQLVAKTAVVKWYALFTVGFTLIVCKEMGFSSRLCQLTYCWFSHGVTIDPTEILLSRCIRSSS